MIPDEIFEDQRLILFAPDVRWLIDRCPEGRAITRILSDRRLDAVRDDLPILLMRQHDEPIPGKPNETRCVILAMLPPGDGPPELTEFACDIDDLLRVIKTVRIPESDDVEDDLEAQWRPPRQRERPWAGDDARWSGVLGHDG